MKWNLRDLLIAFPIFAVAIAIYLHKLQCIEAIRKSNELNIPYQGPPRWLNEGPVFVFLLVGSAILFGRWRIAAILGIPALILTILFYAGWIF